MINPGCNCNHSTRRSINASAYSEKQTLEILKEARKAIESAKEKQNFCSEPREREPQIISKGANYLETSFIKRDQTFQENEKIISTEAF